MHGVAADAAAAVSAADALAAETAHTAYTASSDRVDEASTREAVSIISDPYVLTHHTPPQQQEAMASQPKRKPKINPHMSFQTVLDWIPPAVGAEVLEASRTLGYRLLGIAQVTLDESQSKHMLHRLNRKNHWKMLATYLGAMIPQLGRELNMSYY